jgi:DNA-binding protein H-NS
MKGVGIAERRASDRAAHVVRRDQISAVRAAGSEEGVSMKNNFLKSMAANELWTFYEQVSSTLTRKIAEEKPRLEERLRKVQAASNAITLDRARRPYPKVLPKYRNPQNDAETWSGRGKQPRWLRAELRSGKRLSSFLIARRQKSAVRPYNRSN